MSKKINPIFFENLIKNYNLELDTKLRGFNDNLDYLLSNKFIDLLNQGLEKGKKQINIESNQKNIIFYVYNKRHTQEDMNYYINLFNAFNEALSQ